jgi:nodulation protein A
MASGTGFPVGADGQDGDELSDGVWFTVHWEGDLTLTVHQDIAYTLRQAYPDIAVLFPKARSWAGLRPELRLLAWTAAGVVGHYAVARRFIQVGRADQLVGETGLLAIHPDVHRRDLRADLLRRMGQVLGELGVPFGFTNLASDLIGPYRAAGWHELPGVRTTLCLARGPSRPVTIDYPAVVLPVTAPIEQWPPGTLIRLNGPEL